MNLQKISEFFPWDGESKLESHCILCLDQSALVNTSHSGEFLFTTLLLKLLQNAHLAKSSTEGVTSSSGKQHGSVGSLTKVVLVLTNHNRQHYEAIIKKNYLDLKVLERADKIVVVNIYTDEEQKLEATTGCPWKSAVLQQDANSKHWTWKEFEEWQEQGMKWSGISSHAPSEDSSSYPESSYILMVDDLEVFEIIAESIPAARNFLSQTISLMDGNQGGGVNGLICFGRHPVETKMQLPSMTEFFVVQNDQSLFSAGSSNFHLAHTPLHSNGQPKLSEYMRYRADITLVASPLMTGHSSTIHGTIAVQQSTTPKKLLLQFKALDSGIMCAPRGDGW